MKVKKMQPIESESGEHYARFSLSEKNMSELLEALMVQRDVDGEDEFASRLQERLMDARDEIRYLNQSV